MESITDIYNTDEYYFEDMLTTIFISSYPPIPPEVGRIVIAQHYQCPKGEDDPNCNSTVTYKELELVDCPADKLESADSYFAERIGRHYNLWMD